ncbi:MAG: XRE family transcriptional regulator, partial [Alphaproteobacteria bacterium]
ITHHKMTLKSPENSLLGSTFNPKRLTLARERRGLTKKKLAELVGLSVRAITGYELGEYLPESMDMISNALRFPVSFFMSDNDLFQPKPETVSFRSLSTLTAPKRDAAIGSASIACMLDDWIEQHFGRPKLNVPDFRGMLPEEAANAVRVTWGLGEKPIKHMVQLLESKGIRVYSLAEMANEADALSFWREQTPFVLLNIQKSPERSRFDAAHELGHLVLHRHGGPIGHGENQDVEKVADAFASAFLMPRSGLLASVPPLPTLGNIVQLKTHWLVSAMAMVYRLKDVGAISDWHSRILFQDLSIKGFRRSEPDGMVQRETSPTLSKIFEVLRNDHITKSQVADELDLLEEELEQHVFGLVIQGIHGSAVPHNSKPRVSGKPSLRVVK